MVKKIMVTQVRSALRRPGVQRETLRGLGLGRLNRCKVLQDTPSVRGMLFKVSHLVQVKDVV